MSLEIREVISEDELLQSLNVIRNAFLTVANEFGITKENAPTNPAFAELESLFKMKNSGVKLYGAFEGGEQAGFVAIQNKDGKVFYMERLAVAPEFRHKGYGRQLMDFVFSTVKQCGGEKVSIGIINENKVLKQWYSGYGFTETGTKRFAHLPFEVCFMEKYLYINVK